MPVIKNSSYKPHFVFRNNHINTIAPNILRRVQGISYKRERINTPDNDFLDIDFSCVQSNAIAIILHGLEGNSNRVYIKGVVKAVNRANWDAVALNLRGCSDEPNNLFSSYHSGKTDDLDLIINHLIHNYNYSQIFLIGFSLGGNITLKYIGEMSDKISPKVKAAVAISTPCNLKDTSLQLSKASNFIYLKRFIRSLRQKAIQKVKKHPESNISIGDLKKVRDFYDIDDLYTAPAHGFIDAEDYWEKCSCLQFIPRIKIPALLISAQDDPFLPDSCYPYEEAQKSNYFYLEVPKYGGHVGFTSGINFKGEFWHESRIVEFICKSKLTLC